ncbi:MAG TPA: bifunctional homocysteine S-methyltransferase/methylenetetrahydrofolate reductase [Acidobacteriota bacterium]|nr:bifunctional homocysteine S-methyltransferase/methylenetetrahydrofolate reductase [Acidobacteriota bacterium]
MSKFLKRLKKGVLVGDGAMGTFLIRELGHGLRCVEEANLTHPDLVLSAHLQYIAAGAELIETNTFGANRSKLREFNLEGRFEEINSRAVKIAREARDIAGKDVIIGGSIGPAGFVYDFINRHDRRLAEAYYREQAEILEQRGVEVFIVETFPSTSELKTAVQAIRSVSSLPIMAHLTFAASDFDAGGDFEDLDLQRAIKSFQEIADLPVEVLGLNCGMGPRESLQILEHIDVGDREGISIYPNAGVPSRRGGRFIYPDSSPEYFAAFALEAIRLGANIVGGCCGTRPEHIRAMADAIRSSKPMQREQVIASAPSFAVRPEAPTTRPSALAEKFEQRKFVVSVQIDPPKGPETSRLMDAVQMFKESGVVDAVDVNSNPMARLHMDSLWMSAQIEQAGLPTIPHITPRDASIMGLQSNLLGAHAAGIRNLLVITGDPSQLGGQAGGMDVYQTDSAGLVRLISELNRGLDAAGNLIGTPTNFFVGVAVNPAAPDLAVEADRFRKKIEAGASFAMTQVFFDWECWFRFLDVFREPLPIPVLAAVWPLTSYRLALRLHHEVPGIVVPEKVLSRLEAAGKEARKVGFDLARTMLETARKEVPGVYVIAPFKDPAAALEVLK